MKTTKLWAVALILGLALFGTSSAALRAQQAVSNAKVIGTWDVEIMAEGQSYYLTLVLSENQGQLEGKISEQSGMFTNVPLTGVEWEGTTLKFGVKIPTPPDGTERATKCEMKYADGKLAGTLIIEDLGLTAAVTGIKK